MKNIGFYACISLTLFCLTFLGCAKEASPAASAEAPPAAGPAAKTKAPQATVSLPPVVAILPPKNGVKIDPISLRTILLRDDISVMESMNNVYIAKEGIAAAHANLLPTFNVGAMVGAGTFGFGSAVAFLMPFLSPANWMNLDASKRQLAATGYAFYLVELNEYTQAYSVYLQMLADQEIELQQQVHFGNVDQIRKFVEAAVKQGGVNKAFLQQAVVASDLTHLSLLNQDKAIADSRIAIRRALGFELNKEFYLEESHPAEMPEEKLAPQQLLAKVFAASPEVRQIDSLLAAAKDGTWSAGFGFLGGATGSYDFAGGANPFSASGGMNIGFGIFPAVEISKLREQELQLRRRQIWLEEGKAIESALVGVASAKAQLADARDGEKNARDAYAFAQAEFAAGRESLTDVISASDMAISTATVRIGTRLKLDLARVSLARILIANEFAAIPKCKLDPKPQNGDPFGWLADIFDPRRNRISVDELCRR